MSMQSMSQVTKLVSSCEEGICSRSVRLSRSSRLDMSEVDMEDGVVGCCCKVREQMLLFVAGFLNRDHTKLRNP